MGEEDIWITATAEKDADLNNWNQNVRFHGQCKLGCEGHKMLSTGNLIAALRWETYHRGTEEHMRRLAEKQGDSITLKPKFIDNMPKIGGPND
jgi:hypothetical protein